MAASKIKGPFPAAKLLDANDMPADILFYEGTSLIRTGDDSAAERVFRMALQLAPDFAEVHANLGYVLDQQNRYEEAEVHYLRAVELMPGQIQNHLNFGAMLAKQKRFAEAEVAYRNAITLDPVSPSAWSNLGVLLACTKCEQEAEQCYRTAMAHSPAHRNSRFNLAYLLLRQGRYEEGWQCLEARDWNAPLENALEITRWQGESLAGKTLLIGYEAGHGDMIQFCRYAPLIKLRGAIHLSILCHPALKTLLTTLSGVDEVIAFDETLPKHGWDYWIPLLSLPLRFSTRIDTIPDDLPYLEAEPAKIRQWASIMGNQGKELCVGLVWKGNPRFENDADRSLTSLADLAPLGAVAGVRYYSLQSGLKEDGTATFPQPLTLMDLSPHIADFSDTAAIIMNLDLVISVDTATAHLAGALGKPCWVMLPEYKTDWRWLSNRPDSPWYPGVMRLFRQKHMGDWTSVIAEVSAELQAIARSSR